MPLRFASFDAEALHTATAPASHLQSLGRILDITRPRAGIIRARLRVALPVQQALAKLVTSKGGPERETTVNACDVAAMKLTVVPESLLERLGLWAGLVPTPLFETHMSAMLARSIMAGVELGVFESLESGPLAAIAIAKCCATDLHATNLLLTALAGCGYLELSCDRYALTPKSRKWLLRSSKNSVRDKILLQAYEWRWVSHLEEFVRTGRPLDFHATMSGIERELYHRSMRAIAGIAGREVAWRTPVPRHATRMLDLGGSHGHFAASICRRHTQLHAQILDLPSAVEVAAPLLAAEGLGSRVIHLAGDVNRADLGCAQFDLVFMSNLAHHLTDDQNRSLAQRVARALRPGGMFVVQEAVKLGAPQKPEQTGTLLGLYFGLQSASNVTTWTAVEIRSWQANAGLTPMKTVPLRSAPGWVQQSARL